VTYETILYEVADRIATITFNRPHRYNAINEQMAKELNDAYGRAESDDEVWTLIVTATGKAFCSGADVEKIPARAATCRTTVNGKHPKKQLLPSGRWQNRSWWP
jgi:enoyl-CoA hydratase/carnithine racemase